MHGLEQKIIQALDIFNLPIYYAEIPSEEITNMHYFYFRETGLTRNGTAHLTQTYEVAYVSVEQDDLMEEEIIQALESKNFKFRDAVYERVKLESTNQFVDLVVFAISKPIIKSGCA